MKAKQRIMVGADVLGRRLASDGAIEHPTHCDAIDVGTFDAKTDDATRRPSRRWTWMAEAPS
jgi:hypothetical protein